MIQNIVGHREFVHKSGHAVALLPAFRLGVLPEQPLKPRTKNWFMMVPDIGEAFCHLNIDSLSSEETGMVALTPAVKATVVMIVLASDPEKGNSRPSQPPSSVFRGWRVKDDGEEFVEPFNKHVWTSF